MNKVESFSIIHLTSLTDRCLQNYCGLSTLSKPVLDKVNEHLPQIFSFSLVFPASFLNNILLDCFSPATPPKLVLHNQLSHIHLLENLRK